LAEEEATTIIEVERLLKQALKCAENAYRKSQQLLEQGHNQDIVHSKNEKFPRETIRFCYSFLERNTNILIYVKRRLGMCARKLGKLREATKIFRDLVKEFPMMSVFNIHENLIEVLLTLQNYPDVQGVLAKYDGNPSMIFFVQLISLFRH
jgi:tetratricopeptide (TPR) repeat protein